MWDPKHYIVGTKEKNRMEHAHIESGRRSTGKGSPWRDPWREEKPRSTDEKMERRTGITGHRPKRREEEEEEEACCQEPDKRSLGLSCNKLCEVELPGISQWLPTQWISSLNFMEPESLLSLPWEFCLLSLSWNGLMQPTFSKFVCLISGLLLYVGRSSSKVS